jgi:hypothetical protein
MEVSSRRQPTMGGLPTWVLGVGLTTPHRKGKKVMISLLQDMEAHRVARG